MFPEEPQAIPEESVRNIERMLMSMDGHLADQVRLRFGLERVVEYLYAARMQQRRIDEYLYTPSESPARASRFPTDRGAALCEAHFYFICWDSIYKVIENLRRTCYGLVTPREVLKRHRPSLEKYRHARDHLEHFPERLPGQKRTDWKGDSNSITGSVAGIRRDGMFVFQGEVWDVTQAGVDLLDIIVSEFIAGVLSEVTARHESFLNGESAMWAVRDKSHG